MPRVTLRLSRTCPLSLSRYRSCRAWYRLAPRLGGGAPSLGRARALDLCHERPRLSRWHVRIESVTLSTPDPALGLPCFACEGLMRGSAPPMATSWISRGDLPRHHLIPLHPEQDQAGRVLRQPVPPI